MDTKKEFRIKNGKVNNILLIFDEKNYRIYFVRQFLVLKLGQIFFYASKINVKLPQKL